MLFVTCGEVSLEVSPRQRSSGEASTLNRRVAGCVPRARTIGQAVGGECEQVMRSGHATKRSFV